MDDEKYLVHYGVLGMKWGVKKSDHISRSTKRKAKKDAKEFARAKMFYGEGAGTRRKLINATVNDRSKNLKGYRKEFDKRLSQQDMAKHTSAAKKERKKKDAVKGVKKTARGLINTASGNAGKAGAFAIGLYGIGRITGANKVVAKYGKLQFQILAHSLKKDMKK